MLIVSKKRGVMAVFLTDGREVIVPVSMFPDIKRLTRAQREDYMIMDDQYFSFINEEFDTVGFKLTFELFND